jgi:CheY-like chemotaxis protein
MAVHPPDCGLLDLRMPGLYGFGVLHFLAGRPPRRLPVMVITGQDEPGNTIANIADMTENKFIAEFLGTTEPRK